MKKTVKLDAAKVKQAFDALVKVYIADPYTRAKTAAEIAEACDLAPATIGRYLNVLVDGATPAAEIIKEAFPISLRAIPSGCQLVDPAQVEQYPARGGSRMVNAFRLSRAALCAMVRAQA